MKALKFFYTLKRVLAYPLVFIAVSLIGIQNKLWNPNLEK